MKYKHPKLHRIIILAKELLIAFFWVVIFVSIFVPNAFDYWLADGFTK